MRGAALVNVAAIERNVATLRDRLTGGAALCAVVKADGYGHGAVAAARAALAGGAAWLAVVTAAEAEELRRAGIDARLLVLGPLDDEDLRRALDADADVVVWERAGLERLRALRRPARVHVKLDSGMGRLGQRDPAEATRIAEELAADDRLALAGAMTHFATADEPDEGFLDAQIDRFRRWAEPLRDAHPGTVLHAANSAALLAREASHLDLVRPGVALYGLDPFQRDPAAHGLEPALEWRSTLVSVKPLEAGESVGYGRRFVAAAPTTIGTVPQGYADGVRRALRDSGSAVLVGGRRVPMVGTVSMDSFGVDLGPDAADRPGDVVRLIGRDGEEAVRAEDVAAWIGTINYEVTCAIGARVPRVHHRDGRVLGPLGS